MAGGRENNEEDEAPQQSNQDQQNQAHGEGETAPGRRGGGAASLYQHQASLPRRRRQLNNEQTMTAEEKAEELERRRESSRLSSRRSQERKLQQIEYLNRKAEALREHNARLQRENLLFQASLNAMKQTSEMTTTGQHHPKEDVDVEDENAKEQRSGTGSATSSARDKGNKGSQQHQATKHAFTSHLQPDDSSPALLFLQQAVAAPQQEGEEVSRVTSDPPMPGSAQPPSHAERLAQELLGLQPSLSRTAEDDDEEDAASASGDLNTRNQVHQEHEEGHLEHQQWLLLQQLYSSGILNRSSANSTTSSFGGMAVPPPSSLAAAVVGHGSSGGNDQRIPSQLPPWGAGQQDTITPEAVSMMSRRRLAEESTRTSPVGMRNDSKAPSTSQEKTSGLAEEVGAKTTTSRHNSNSYQVDGGRRGEESTTTAAAASGVQPGAPPATTNENLPGVAISELELQERLLAVLALQQQALRQQLVQEGVSDDAFAVSNRASIQLPASCSGGSTTSSTAAFSTPSVLGQGGGAGGTTEGGATGRAAASTSDSPAIGSTTTTSTQASSTAVLSEQLMASLGIQQPPYYYQPSQEELLLRELLAGNNQPRTGHYPPTTMNDNAPMTSLNPSTLAMLLRFQQEQELELRPRTRTNNWNFVTNFEATTSGSTGSPLPPLVQGGLAVTLPNRTTALSRSQGQDFIGGRLLAGEMQFPLSSTTVSLSTDSRTRAIPASSSNASSTTAYYQHQQAVPIRHQQQVSRTAEELLQELLLQLLQQQQTQQSGTPPGLPPPPPPPPPLPSSTTTATMSNVLLQPILRAQLHEQLQRYSSSLEESTGSLLRPRGATTSGNTSSAPHLPEDDGPPTNPTQPRYREE